MSRRLKQLPALSDNQQHAANPAHHAALSASAGTGKTQVLTARVLRLLLQGVAPETILCLTFTKAAAAEMANRIGARLAYWARLDEARLVADLKALGEDATPPQKELARQLFARVLDAPGGGLRIQTIHSFAQGLLASFPAEAGIPAGFEAMDERQQEELSRRVLADLADAAETQGDEGFLADLSALSLRLGEDGARSYLMACAARAPTFDLLPTDDEIEPMLRRVIDLPEGSAEDILSARLAQLDQPLFDRLIAANRAAAGSAKTPAAILERLTAFVAADVGTRIVLLDDLGSGIVKKTDGELTKPTKGQLEADDDYVALAEQFRLWWLELVRIPRLVALVEVQAAGLRAGRRFAQAYAANKRAVGLADFDDLIRWTVNLLGLEGMGDWVRFKLDQRTDHILVDEAQDNNGEQWAIIGAMADEYFFGNAEVEEAWRTFFMVGDFKQSIYSFQGSEPEQFLDVRDDIRQRVAALQQSHADAGGGKGEPRAFRDLDITTSFRSAPAILELVDAVIAKVGHEEMGLRDAPPAHVAFNDQLKGAVDYWPPFAVEDDANEDEGEEGWLTDRDRLFAKELAQQIKAMVTGEDAVSPGDILILLRRRSELAALIVARLYEAEVPVAGIDRLLLSRPLAVRDLVAALRFAVQPLDDLNTACLLVSPLVGWSQDELYALARPRKGALWDALRGRRDENVAHLRAHQRLSSLLADADYLGPAAFLEKILSGPIQGRKALLHRLGEEARDPIDELMLSALDFEAREIGSLDRFLDWLARGDVEVKREAAEAGSAVRVMTVHGAKGLEAPVVILADATADPDNLGGARSTVDFDFPIGRTPLVRPRKDELVTPYAELIEAQKAADKREHWRLLYVALTRAEQRLIVTGPLPTRRLSADCWLEQVREALEHMGAQAFDAPWGEGGLRWASGSRRKSKGLGRRTLDELTRPAWLDAPAPPEARPPRPLSPSAPEEGEEENYPPPGPEARAAARRGTLLHALFERLPPVARVERRETALRWLKVSGGVEDAARRDELVDAALAVIEAPDFADLFGPAALAEAPIAATLSNGRVIAGTVDRLLIKDDRILVVDFKTGRFVPQDPASVPTTHARQMQAYADALRVIFPDRRVEAALLYTAGPRLIALAT
ncbi:double-strand break repair helicase AddA [Sphingomicrobium flavum]|uniref:double-strand break repair helicase AddA n=1 Tax=Sphingomicrobium flavum TaxID=1229164 RepID=UPI0021AE0DDA|nr:double-strand break repair helicase AddA [Sphingomicrobium flavum]